MYMNLETGEMSETYTKSMVEVEPCEYCGEWVEAEAHRTRRDRIFCNNECMCAFYYFEVPHDEYFIEFN